MNIVDKVVDNIKIIIKGKDDTLYEILKGVIAGGHILIEDVPGVGKTSIAEALSKSFDVKYSRMQFTPDLLPTDILGVSI
ncbi:MAG: magnesium chelatase, partial [Clostridium sp.]|nr:magnesium chelatase [Clostridium sp.]